MDRERQQDLLAKFDLHYSDLTEFAHRAGLEATDVLLEIFGGTKPHIPKPGSFWRGLERAVRNEQIRIQFRGDNLEEVAHAHGLSPRHVQQIVSGEAKRPRKAHSPCTAVRMTQALHDEVADVAARHGLSVRALIEDLVAAALSDPAVRARLRQRYGEQRELLRTTDRPTPLTLTCHA